MLYTHFMIKISKPSCYARTSYSRLEVVVFHGIFRREIILGQGYKMTRNIFALFRSLSSKSDQTQFRIDFIDNQAIPDSDNILDFICGNFPSSHL